MPEQTGTKTASSSGEQAILEAAEYLFAEKGFDAVSMSAIAKLANSSKPNIYHHFKNKDELYLSIMKNAVQSTSTLLDTLEDAPGSIRQRLADFYAERTLTKTPITPGDQAEAIFLLLSKRLAKTTGQIINVDGGLPEAFLR